MTMDRENAAQRQAFEQRRAFENRDSILPGDRLLIACTKATKDTAEFKMKRRTLYVSQPPEDPIKAGQLLPLYCYEQRIARNGLGFFVDYHFDLADLGQVIINGPDAQSLYKLDHAYGVTENDRKKVRR